MAYFLKFFCFAGALCAILDTKFMGKYENLGIANKPLENTYEKLNSTGFLLFLYIYPVAVSCVFTIT